MDSPSDANNQIVPVSGGVPVSDKSQKEEPSVDQEAGQSSESAVVAAPPPSPSPSPPPAQNYQLVIPENDRDYGCQYCKKKFSNKQALGGHQNAHKVERLMVKNTQDHRKTLDNYRSSYHGRSGAGGPSFMASYRHRYSPYSFGCTGHHHSGSCSVVIPYTSRPMLPPSGSFPGWPAPPPAPIMGPYRGSAHYSFPVNITVRLPNFEAGSSNAGAGQGQGQGRPAAAAGPINLRNVPEPEEDDDSDIDLSLKLSYDK